MKELNDIVVAQCDDLIKTGAVEEMIRKSLEKSVASSIEDALRSYSDFGKALSNHIQESLQVSLDQLNLDQYNQTILKMIEGFYAEELKENAKERLLTQLNKLFQPAPDSIGLQDIVTSYIEKIHHLDREDAEQIVLIIKHTEYGFTHIGLNPKPRSYSGPITDIHECEVQISIHNKELSWVDWSNGRRGSREFIPTPTNSFARRLYQMYCHGTKIEIPSLDADDYDTYYPGADY